MASNMKTKPKTKGVANLIKSFLKRESKAKRSLQTVLPGKKKHISAIPVEKNPETVKKTCKLPAPRFPVSSYKSKKSNVSILDKKNEIEANHSFYLSPNTTITGPKYFFHSDISDTYNETYMRLIPRDPEWLFVYWEISEPSMNELKRKMGDEFASNKKLLRLCDVTGIHYNGSNAGSYTDIEINGIANNWYLKVPETGRAYVVECGFLTSQGRYILAVRSNLVHVPRSGLSPVLDQEWTTASSDELIRMSADGLKRNLGASEKRFGIVAGETEKQETIFAFSAGSGSGMPGIGIR